MGKTESSASGRSRRGPGRPKAGSEDKSARILEEALNLFSRVGYDGASLEDIARASDLSKAGLLHHYPSKEALFAAVLEERDRRSTLTITETLGLPVDRQTLPSGLEVDAWEALRSWEHVLEENFRNVAGTSLYVTLGSSVTNPDHPAHEWFTTHLSVFLNSFCEVLEQGKKRGTVDPAAPSMQIARILAAVSDGLQLQYLAHVTDLESGDEKSLKALDTDIVSEAHLVIQMIEDRWRIR